MEKYKIENGVQNVPITIFLNLENEDHNVTDFNDLEGEFITWREHESAYSQDPEYILKSEHERLLSDLKQHLIDTGEMVPADQWISVKDKLPEIGQYVQACIPGGVLLYSCVLEKNNTWYGYGYSQPETRITHWNPLPPAPGEHNIDGEHNIKLELEEKRDSISFTDFIATAGISQADQYLIKGVYKGWLDKLKEVPR